MTPKIWHNPRCSKSRQTLALLEEHGQSPEVVLYLKEPPSAAEIAEALSLLDLKPYALIRKSEATYKTLGLAKDTTDAALIAAMAANPILIERPIVFANGKAALGRPPEAVLALF